MRAVVCQSYRAQDVPGWIGACLDSVKAWAKAQDYDYRFVGDDILDLVPAAYRAKAAGRWPVLTDYARLALLTEMLGKGYDSVLWLDADVLVFAPEAVALPADVSYAFGRELWVQPEKGGLAVRRNVHNAVVLMRPGNPVLDFYAHACERVITRIDSGFPDQVVGPKLLGALHNIVGFPLIDSVGMFSPPVVRDIAAGGGPATEMLRAASAAPLGAANLCSSLVGKDTDDALLEAAVESLLAAKVF
jgi:hypothetical protein